MRILILGGTGFVGRNLAETLSKDFTVFQTARSSSDPSFFYFDLADRSSWKIVNELDPEVIINAAAFGVVKNEQDVHTMYAVNYFLVSEFYEYVTRTVSNPFWLQIGTAFEYDLSIQGGIGENTNCLPMTHYGISKLLFSQYLAARSPSDRYLILRPFGMFGKYEDESKFFPMLLLAQQRRQAVKLSAGTQRRDYFFVKDLGTFIGQLIANGKLGKVPPVINLGSGKGISLRDYASVLSAACAHFDASFWQWGSVESRMNESQLFYNSSPLATSIGFVPSDLRGAFQETILYYNAL